MASLDMNHLPHVCDIYRKDESIIDTDRLAAPTYTKTVSAYPCYMEPMDSEEMAGLGYSFDSAVYLMFGATTIKDTVTMGDVCIYGGFAYVIRKMDIYDQGAPQAQHIEAIIERLPATPDGIA